MAREISFRGTSLHLVGRNLSLRTTAPDCILVSQELAETRLLEPATAVRLLTSFPSLDTPVCDLQVREFNSRASSLSPGIRVTAISKDLPFAQKRFCSANSITQLELLSDYRDSSFGLNYGLLIREWNLLARAIVILDRAHVVRYIQVVPELSSQPDYDAALAAAEHILKNPAVSDARPASRCKPCEDGTPPLPPETVQRLMAEHRGWESVEGRKITKVFRFTGFPDAKIFVDIVALIARDQGHHPTLTWTYDRLRVTLTTHAAGGLTDNDFTMARLIDEV